MAFKDIVGQKFNRLTIYARIPNRGDGIARFLCLCDCGKPAIANGIQLRNGKRKSCGCLQKEKAKNNAAIARKNLITHGMSYSTEYSIWSGMIARCKYKTMQNYKKYGGRGITVCEKWQESFEAFYNDMGPRPSLNHSIERIDVNGNYEPGNCRWATKEEQANNTRGNHFVIYQEKKMTVAQAIRLANLDISPGTVRGRMQKGWTFEDAISKPRQKKKVA